MLRRVADGLFVIDAMADEWSALALARAAIAAGAAARQSAAHLHVMALFGSVRYRTTELHVVAPNSVRTRSDLATYHQTRFLPQHHLTVVRGIATTTAARTLCDLAAVLRPSRLRAVVERQAIVSAPSLDDLVSCHLELARRGRRGTQQMRDLLDSLVSDEPFPESELELRLDRALRDRGLVLRRQYRPPWYDGIRNITDFADQSGATILEADGRRFHDTSAAFEDDRRRDRLAASHDWLTLRVTWRDVVSNGHALDEVTAIILRRQAATQRDTNAA